MRILMVGLGSIGQRHLRNLRGLPGGGNFEIAAYRERGLSRTFSDDMRVLDGVDLEKRYGVTAFRDFDEALAWGPDVVFVTNITSKHIEFACRAASAGCDIFVEKPLSDSLEGAEELVDLVERGGLMAGMGYQNRYHPCVRNLRDLLDDGSLGRALHVEAEYGERLATMHSYEDYRGTYMARSDMGGGAILNLLVHDLDLLQWLFGRPERVVAAPGGSTGYEVDVEDCSSAIFMLSDAGGQKLTAYVHADFAQSPATHRLKAVCERGWVEIDFNAAAMEVHVERGDVVRRYEVFARNDMFIEELERFLRCLNDRVEPDVGLREGMVSLRMALAMRESLATGKWVEV